MIDEITIKRIDLLHPLLRHEVADIYKEICAALSSHVYCRFAYTLRTFSEQDALYARGRTIGNQVVTNAMAGQSYHNYGLAVDIVLIQDGKAIWNRGEDFDGDKIPDWMEVVKIFRKFGWEWGGDFVTFKDYPHFQKAFGYTCKQLMALPKHSGTTYPILP